MRYAIKGYTKNKCRHPLYKVEFKTIIAINGVIKPNNIKALKRLSLPWEVNISKINLIEPTIKKNTNVRGVDIKIHVIM